MRLTGEQSGGASGTWHAEQAALREAARAREAAAVMASVPEVGRVALSGVLAEILAAGGVAQTEVVRRRRSAGLIVRVSGIGHPGCPVSWASDAGWTAYSAGLASLDDAMAQSEARGPEIVRPVSAPVAPSSGSDYSPATGDGVRDAGVWAREAYACGDSMSDE